MRLNGSARPMARQRGAHPLAAFRHRLVGQADDVEQAAAAVADMHLHIDFAGLDALKGNGINMRDGHSAPSRAGSLAAFSEAGKAGDTSWPHRYRMGCRMKRLWHEASSTVIAALAFSPVRIRAGTAAANAPGMAVESVIVTAPKDRPEKQLDNFIIAHAAPSPLPAQDRALEDRHLSLTIGLPPKLEPVCQPAHHPRGDGGGRAAGQQRALPPNVIVAATPQPQEVLDLIREKRPALLGYHYTSQAKRTRHHDPRGPGLVLDRDRGFLRLRPGRSAAATIGNVLDYCRRMGFYPSMSAASGPATG